MDDRYTQTNKQIITIKVGAIGAWHKRGIELGAIDKGETKIWTDFGPNYYAAYLTDPDGWQLEAMFKTNL